MTKDIIHFSHANGFPALSYSVMLDALQKHYDVDYIHVMGHDENYPVNNNWSQTVDELLAYVEKNYSQPIIAVGHSFGGVVNYLAAQARPELFKQVILLDSPIIPPLVGRFIWLAKILGFIDSASPAKRTLGRKDTWANEQEAFEYLKVKSLLRQTDSRCLKDYIKFGTETCEQGIKLIFDPDIEVEIFRTVPDDMHKRAGKSKVPVSMVYGEKTNVITPKIKRYAKSVMGIDVYSLPGTHLFPLEVPEQTANTIHNLIEKNNHA